MVALDCESFDSALATSAALLAMQPGDLLQQLQAFDYDNLPEADRQSYPLEQLLPLRLFGVGRGHLPTPPLVHWFHATRVPSTTTFEKGILPTSAVLDRIWTFLGTLASEWSTANEWEHFRTAMPATNGDGAW
jgi:hypothetical protein